MWCIDKIFSGDNNPKGERKPDFSWLEPQQPRITALNEAMGYVGHLPEINPRTPIVQRIVRPEHLTTSKDITEQIRLNIVSRIRKHMSEMVIASNLDKAIRQQLESEEV